MMKASSQAAEGDSNTTLAGEELAYVLPCWMLLFSQLVLDYEVAGSGVVQLSLFVVLLLVSLPLVSAASLQRASAAWSLCGVSVHVCDGEVGTCCSRLSACVIVLACQQWCWHEVVSGRLLIGCWR